MQATGGLAVERTDGRPGRTRISRLHSEAPLVLRPTHELASEPMPRWGLRGSGTARISLVAGAAGPIGGDRLRLDVAVGAQAALVLRAVAATLVLPGPHGRPSSTHVTLRVEAGGTLVWLPGPTIAARNCDHRATTVIALEPGARLLVREELILGRTGERPGTVRQRLRVTLAGRPLHDQELHIGPHAPGWDGPAGTGGRRAVGTLLVVDADEPPMGPRAAASTDSALMRLDGPAILLTALAPDALALRRRLEDALVLLGQTRMALSP